MKKLKIQPVFHSFITRLGLCFVLFFLKKSIEISGNYIISIRQPTIASNINSVMEKRPEAETSNERVT